MSRLFSDERLDPAKAAHRAAPPLNGAPPPPAAIGSVGEQIRQSLAGKYVCPFCGSMNENEQGVCPRCTMENTAASRKATKLRIGPWYVLQTRNPAAPGMKFETLLSFVKKGRVKPQSVVRGPTTHQLWRFAAQVKGLSREFGVCYTCAASIPPGASVCPQCNRLQDPPANPDVLLESSKEGVAPPPAAAPAPAAPPPAAPRPAEPRLDAADEDFVIPTLGNLTDSMAGFSLNDSISGMTIDQPWVRLDKAARPPGGGNGRSPANRPAAAAPPPGNYPAPPGPAAYNPATGYTAPGYPPSPYPPQQRPGAPTPANGKKPTADGFLTARDLAAAFRLELADGRAAPAPGPARQPAYAPPPAAAEFGGIDPASLYAASRRRQGGGWKILLTLMFLAAAGFGVAAAVSEDVRRASADWFNRAKAAVQSPPGDAPAAPTGTAGPTLPSPAGMPALTTPPKRSPPPAAPAATRPAAAASIFSDASPSPPAAVYPATQRAAVPAPANATPEMSPGPAAEAKVMKLWNEALTAEERRDWATAITKYQEIKTLPKPWPGPLDINLRLAKEQLEAK